MDLPPTRLAASSVRLSRWSLTATTVVDAAVLFGLLKTGIAPGTASLVSLPIAAALVRVAGRASARRRSPAGPLVFEVILTVFLRGGILAWMERIPGCPVIVTAAVAAAAAGLLLWAAAGVDWSAWKTGDKQVPIWRRAVPALVAYVVLLRLVYLGLPELLHQEAYYWNYSRHLALSFLDHPPMVAWLIRACTTVLGQTELGVRSGAFASWLVGAFFVFRLARRVYDSTTAAASTLVFAVLPVYFLAGLFMSPDAPLTACWAATLFYFYRALIDERPKAWWGVGVFLGLGLLAKYTIVLLGFAVLAFMLADRRARRLFLRPWPWLAAGLALVLFAPVIVWNSQNQWISFAFQSSRRAAGAFSFSLPDLLGAAAILVTPVGLAAVAVAAFSRKQLAPSGNPNQNQRFPRGFRLLMTSTLLPFSLFALVSLFRHTKLNWTGPLWIGAVPLMGHMMAAGWPVDAGRARRWLSPRTWRTTVIVVLLLFGALMHYLVLGLPGLSYPKNKLGLPALGWPALGVKIQAVVDDVARETGLEPLVVGLNADRLSSWLAFYRSRAMARNGARNTGAAAFDTAGPNLFGGARSHMYGLWFPSLNQYRDRPLILIGDRPEQLDVHPKRRRLGTILELQTEKNGQPTWRVYYRVLGPVQPTKKKPHG
jgi:dolichol-phosphate mannosyltransferase